MANRRYGPMRDEFVSIAMSCEESLWRGQPDRRTFESEWRAYSRSYDSTNDYNSITGWPVSGYGWPGDEWLGLFLAHYTARAAKDAGLETPSFMGRRP